MDGNLAYQDEFWEELINGEVVAMAPAATGHNFAAGNIYAIFQWYLRGKRCTPFSDGTMVYLTEKDHFIPDMMVVCNPDIIEDNGVHGAPDLAVEVLSPCTAKRDLGYKMKIYERCGVREYWVVNPKDKSVSQYLLEDGELVLHEVYTLYSEKELSYMTDAERAAVVTEFRCSLFDDLTIRLADIFERVK